MKPELQTLCIYNNAPFNFRITFFIFYCEICSIGSQVAGQSCRGFLINGHTEAGHGHLGLGALEALGALGWGLVWW